MRSLAPITALLVCRLTPTTALLLLVTAPALCQELNLFEPVETAQVGDQPQLTPGFNNPSGQPAYTVRSTAKLGDVYLVTLVDRQGKTTAVEWRAGERSPLPEMPAFVVEEIRQRIVVLSQPGNDPCVAAPLQGVSCLDATRAELTLALAAPLSPGVQGASAQAVSVGANGIVVDPAMAPQNPFEAAIQAQQAQAAQAAAQGLPVPIPGGQGFFVNPFNGQAEVVDQQFSPAQQDARQSRQRARSERLNRLVEQARIPDDQIPPGMQRVTTPFGDRLMPIRE